MFSIIAMGTVDNNLTYRSRKNFNDVKKYTKTINPNTSGQQTQKGYFKNAIESWSIDGYSSADKFAWDRFAKTKKVITSGFNRYTGFRIEAEKEGSTWNKLKNCTVYDITDSGFKVDIDVASDLSGILYLGTSKYSMLKEFVGVFSVDHYTFTTTGLSKATEYHFYIKNTSIGEGARTGIYRTKTVVSVPVIITMGSEPIDRALNVAAGVTIINRNNPANDTGVIDEVEIFTKQEMAGVKVGIFFVVSGNNYSTRSYKDIGVVPIGYNNIVVDLAVQTGDLIGIYWYPSGAIARENVLNIGYFNYSADCIPCTDQIFYAVSNRIISLKGSGST